MDDEGVRLSNADDFDAEKRALIARHSGDIKKWIDGVHAKVRDDAYRGKPTPGLKLVAGRRGNRTWTDEDRAAAALLAVLESDDVFGEPPMVSPATVEKLVKKDRVPPETWDSLKALITQADGKPSLVDEDDERPALRLEDEFDDLDDDGDQDGSA